MTWIVVVSDAEFGLRYAFGPYEKEEAIKLSLAFNEQHPHDAYGAGWSELFLLPEDRDTWDSALDDDMFEELP